MSIRRVIIVCGLAGFFLGNQECHAQFSDSTSRIGSWVHPLQEPYEPIEKGKTLTDEQRDQVHFIVVNGFDPLYVGNLNGLADYVQSLGFRNTRLYYLYQMSNAGDDIRALKQQNPNARVVLLGYSWGANAVRSIANQLNQEGIVLDSLIYLGGDTIQNEPRSRPGNVRNCVNICGHGLVFLGYNLYFKGFDLDGVDNHRLAVRHMLLPSRIETIQWVSDEVIRVAMESRSAPAAVPAPAVPGVPAPPSPLTPTQPNMKIISRVTMPPADHVSPAIAMPVTSQAIMPVSLRSEADWQVRAKPRPRYDDE